MTKPKEKIIRRAPLAVRGQTEVAELRSSNRSVGERPPSSITVSSNGQMVRIGHGVHTIELPKPAFDGLVRWYIRPQAVK